MRFGSRFEEGLWGLAMASVTTPTHPIPPSRVAVTSGLLGAQGLFGLVTWASREG